ncbi:YolD-like family protein [Sporosarcina sp. CAU 1771]
MIWDRGNIKWTAMMLPEHVKKLRHWQQVNEEVEKPELNEFELELISDEVTRAYASKLSVQLTYWREGKLANDYGKVIEIDLLSKTIVLDDPFTVTRYKFEEITAVSLME